MAKFLLVEGGLDQVLMHGVIGGSLAVEEGGSKQALKPRAVTIAKARKDPVAFIRDRDFDYDPPEHTSSPVPIPTNEDNVHGWHWCRHEIENYLLEPGLVATAVPSVDQSAYEDEIRVSARTIRDYQAARWTVGVARRSLPPYYRLHTRPAGLRDRDIALAQDCSRGPSLDWAVRSTSDFLATVSGALDKSAVQQRFGCYCQRFSDTFCDDVESVLVWFSGKDLFAALGTWLQSLGYQDPGNLRAQIRDWRRKNPEETLELLHEWKALVDVLHQ